MQLTTLLAEHGIPIRAKKVVLLQHEVEFLGRLISGKVFGPQTLLWTPYSTSLYPWEWERSSAIRGAGQMDSCSRKDESVLAKPLNGLTGATGTFAWLEKHTRAVRSLQDAVRKSYTIEFVDWKKGSPLVLQTDASTLGWAQRCSKTSG